MTDANAVTSPEAPTIGIMYDMCGDLQYFSDDPWDWDAEFEMSTAVGDIANAIEDLGFPTVYIGNVTSLLEGFAKYREKIHMVFNVTDLKIGLPREARVPGVLDAGGIDCVGPDAETLAITRNKMLVRHNMMARNVRMPESVVVSDVKDMRRDEIPEYPVIPKLAHGRSSIDMNEKFKIHDFEHLQKHVRYLLRTYKQDVLVERFIEGSEFDVPIVGTAPKDVFGVMEVTLNDKPMGKNHLTSKIIYKDYYGLDVIRAEGDFAESKRMALAAYNSLGCRDFGRVDIRVEKSTGKPYFLELNPCPYLGVRSSFAHVAKIRGMEYKELIGTILASAMSRYA